LGLNLGHFQLMSLLHFGEFQLTPLLRASGEEPRHTTAGS
jgi:hypothetical protein